MALKDEKHILGNNISGDNITSSHEFSIFTHLVGELMLTFI